MCILKRRNCEGTEQLRWIKYYKKEGCIYDKCSIYGRSYHSVSIVFGDIWIDLQDLPGLEYKKTANPASGVDMCCTEYVWLSGSIVDDVRAEQ